MTAARVKPGTASRVDDCPRRAPAARRRPAHTMHVATTVSAPPSRAAPPPSRVHAPARARVAASSRVASRRPASIPGPSRGVILVRASSSSSDADDVVDADDLGVDVDAIKSMLESNPTVRAQEALIAGEARNAASLRVDADLAEAREKLAMEYGGRAQSSAENLQTTQEKALAELEAKSEAVLRAEAKMNAIAAEREALAREMDAARGGGGENNEMNASSSSSGKWGSTVASDVDEDAERVESGKAGALAALSGTLLSSPLLLSQSPSAGFGDPVALQSVAGVLGAFYTLVPIRPRRRGERRSLRTFAVLSLRPHHGFNPRPRRL